MRATRRRTGAADAREDETTASPLALPRARGTEEEGEEEEGEEAAARGTRRRLKTRTTRTATAGNRSRERVLLWFPHSSYKTTPLLLAFMYLVLSRFFHAAPLV